VLVRPPALRWVKKTRSLLRGCIGSVQPGDGKGILLWVHAPFLFQRMVSLLSSSDGVCAQAFPGFPWLLAGRRWYCQSPWPV
jgi:hypothetical protein